MIRADHPSNTKRGSACIYNEKYLLHMRKIDICILNNVLQPK